MHLTATRRSLAALSIALIAASCGSSDAAQQTAGGGPSSPPSYSWTGATGASFDVIQVAVQSIGEVIGTQHPLQWLDDTGGLAARTVAIVSEVDALLLLAPEGLVDGDYDCRLVGAGGITLGGGTVALMTPPLGDTAIEVVSTHVSELQIASSNLRAEVQAGAYSPGVLDLLDLADLRLTSYEALVPSLSGGDLNRDAFFLNNETIQLMIPITEEAPSTEAEAASLYLLRLARVNSLMTSGTYLGAAGSPSSDVTQALAEALVAYSTVYCLADSALGVDSIDDIPQVWAAGTVFVQAEGGDLSGGLTTIDLSIGQPKNIQLYSEFRGLSPIDAESTITELAGRVNAWEDSATQWEGLLDVAKERLGLPGLEIATPVLGSVQPEFALRLLNTDNIDGWSASGASGGLSASFSSIDETTVEVLLNDGVVGHLVDLQLYYAPLLATGAAHQLSSVIVEVFEAVFFPLPDGFTANAVNGDGSVVVGRFNNDATRWTMQGGLQSLGKDTGHAMCVSSDGLAVAGTFQDLQGFLRAFRWSEFTGVVELPGFPGTYEREEARGMSGDGQVVVGQSFDDPPMGVYAPEAVQWNPFNPNPVKIPFPAWLDHRRSVGIATNQDGSVIVGPVLHVVAGNAVYNGFRWSQESGTVVWSSLPTFGLNIRSIFAVSPNGLVMGGNGVLGDGNQAMFIHESDGSTVLIPQITEPGNMYAEINIRGVADSGELAIGYELCYASVCKGGEAIHATMWTPATGQVFLEDYLQANGVVNVAGWQLQRADALSGDGKVIVGNGTNPKGGAAGWMIFLQGMPER